ncbi:MAG: hypothetical protein KAU95_03125, partial [Candidatus Aenigmarchaeota archaeon]|nr:hypothetical protein [Candidatus Aenigmarchaeota archaeon]
MNEFILVIGMILTGAILFLSSGGYLIHEIEETEGYGVKGTAERIASIMERMYGEPAYARYCINISLSNLKIEQGYMTFEQKEKKYVLPVPKEVKNVDLKEIASICFVRHKTGEIELLEKPPVCDMNGVCTAEECSEECKDCYGPAPICIGDESCDIYIGENCRNSIDCACSLKNGSYVCCPDDPSSDEQGCVDEQRQNLSKGEKCFCDNECDTSTNLICNKVSLGFTDYKKACCPPGYGWDGTDCVALECSYPCAPNCKLPDKWDWRNVDGVNWMNPIRAQAVCGSCWAFSAVAGVEHRYNV